MAEKVYECTFHKVGRPHQVGYVITLRDSSALLLVRLARADSGEVWEGQFDEEFVESLTKKTGNLKSFKVFCKMLVSALERNSESVMLDVLTARDLELLKERKTKEMSHSGTMGSVQGSVL